MNETEAPVKEKYSEIFSILPDIRKEFDILSSKSFEEYENALSKATKSAIKSLQGIIDDDTLAADPEQLVRAVEVLTKSKIGITDCKRKLLETLIKGEVMLRAINSPDKNKDDERSLLDEYLEKQKAITEGNSDGGNVSVFVDIDRKNKNL